MDYMALISRACVLIIAANAAESDIRSWRIPNRSILIWSIAGVVYELTFYGTSGLADKFIGAAIPIALLWVFFSMGMIGAGDVKLLSVLGLWLGTDGILKCLIYSFAIGTVASIVMASAGSGIRKRFYHLRRYFLLRTKNKTDLNLYDAKNARGAKVHVAVFIFLGVLLHISIP